MRHLPLFCFLLLASLAIGLTEARAADRPTKYGTSDDRTVVRPATDADVLYDQSGNLVAGSGYTSQDFEAAFDIYDNQGADDFVVPTGATWTVTQVTAFGVYYNGFGPMPNANVFFYHDSDCYPGELVESRTVCPTTDDAGTVVLDFEGVTLGEGAYWVSVQSVMDFGVGGQWGWSTSSVRTYNGAAWQNPGNGFATGCTTWGRLTTCIGALDPDFAFIIGGTSSTGDRCGDIFAFNARCTPNGTLQAVIKMNGDRTGQTISINIDGTDYNVPLLGDKRHSIARVQVRGAGPGTHTVALTDPADCRAPIVFDCGGDSRPDPEWDALWAEYDYLEAQAALREAVPAETKIIGNYPNPFNPSTTIRYALGTDSPVSVRIYNMLGQEVATLVDGFQKAGEQSVVWNGVNNFGQSVASGLYIYRLQVGNTVMTQKMLFTK